jgi:hypothetical protein
MVAGRRDSLFIDGLQRLGSADLSGSAFSECEAFVGWNGRSRRRAGRLRLHRGKFLETRAPFLRRTDVNDSQAPIAG